MGQAFTVAMIEVPFAEPGFSLLQRQVFADIVQASNRLEMAQAVERERRQRTSDPATPALAPLVRIGAFANDELIGRSYGWFEAERSFYMANSGVAQSHRRAGVYSAMLDTVIARARTAGAPFVRSRHSVRNNPVIICKLQRGFHIAGLGISADLRTLVDLVLHLSPERQALFSERTIPFSSAGRG